MAPELQAILDAMPRDKRDTVRIVLAAARTDATLPACYHVDDQAAVVVVAVWRLKDCGPTRMLKAASGALLDGAVRARAAARRQLMAEGVA